MNSQTRAIIISLSCLLSACAAEGPQPEPAANDSDIVMMSTRGGDGQSVTQLGVKPMTFKELSSCGVIAKDLEVGTTQHNSRLSALTKAKTSLKENDALLDKLRPTIDVRKTKQVDEFNRRLEQLKTDVSHYNADVASFNDEASKMNIRRNSFNTGCGDRAYRHSDLERMPADLRTAIEARSVASDIPITIEDESGEDGNLSSGSFEIREQQPRP